MAFENINKDNEKNDEFDINKNTFDEGVELGGMRSKYEIRTLICYLFHSVNKPMDKALVVEAIQKKGLANYFEISSCFDDLIKHNNIELVDEKENLYFVTDNGEMVAKELERTIATTVRERAYACAIELLEQRRIEKENTVTISKIDNGYNVNFKISGGSVELMSFDLYAPDINQAKLMRKNFYKCPALIYKSIIGSLTRNKELVSESLLEIAKDF
ncbi:MAG: DUF4364 family protein [Ruminococcus sp.]